jgi:DNA-binding NtrC family response regulator
MSKRVLILVDGEPVTTRALALDLRDAGYGVEVAADREDALRKLRRTPFDLLVTTAGPGRGGVGEFVERFRSVRPEAKVVFMTTGGQEVGEEIPSDARAWVQKPFDLEEFRSVVGRLLDSPGSAVGRVM